MKIIDSFLSRHLASRLFRDQASKIVPWIYFSMRLPQFSVAFLSKRGSARCVGVESQGDWIKKKKQKCNEMKSEVQRNNWYFYEAYISRSFSTSTGPLIILRSLFPQGIRSGGITTKVLQVTWDFLTYCHFRLIIWQSAWTYCFFCTKFSTRR